MNAQTFDILCPICRSVVPRDASGCTTCSAVRKPDLAAVSIPAAAQAKVPDVGGMALKEYQRFVRTNYRTVEGPRVAGHSGGSVALKAYLPLALLLLGMIVGAAVVFGPL
jgi:hypothetical protein